MSNFVIEKNTVNNIVLTLSERSQLVDPYYLIVFKSKFSTDDVYKYCSVQNQVSSNIRYDLVVITEQINPVALDGEVYLIEGEWSYNIYESQLPTLLVEETTGRVIQNGFIVVKEQTGN
jgi:hypothetical protein